MDILLREKHSVQTNAPFVANKLTSHSIYIMNKPIIGFDLRISMVRWLAVYFEEPRKSLTKEMLKETEVNKRILLLLETSAFKQCYKDIKKNSDNAWDPPLFAIYIFWLKYFRKFFKDYLRKLYIDSSFNYISACHFHDKSGALALEKAHIHIRFIPKRNKNGRYKTKSALRKLLFDHIDHLDRYNYSITELKIKDMRRFYQYPLKEKYPTFNGGLLTNCFPPATLHSFMRDAHAEWVIACRFHKNKLLQAQSPTLYTKLQIKLDEKYFDSSGIQQATATYKDVYIQILDYYLDNNKAITPNNIQGYSNLYLLKRGFMTKQTFYIKQHHK